MAKRKRLKSTFLVLVCFGLLSLASVEAQAKKLDLIEAAEKKQTIISGVLNPPSISVNGTEIKQASGVYSALLVNGKEVKTTETGSLETFYEVVEGDQVKLEWKKSDGSLVSILEFSYPAVSEMNLNHTQFVLKFNDQTKRAKFNNEDIDISNPKIDVPSTASWIEVPHTLELFSDRDISRIYNLNFKKYKTDLLTSTSWSVCAGDGQFSANVHPTTYGVSSRVLNENNFSHEIFAGVAKVSYGLGNGPPFFNSVRQETFELKYRFGFNPNQTNSGDIDYRRLTVGLQASAINYKRDSDFTVGNMDGYVGTTADTWFTQGGYFFRWEPLQYGNFGISLTFDFRALRSEEYISSDKDVKTVGLSYYFDPAVLKFLTSKRWP